MLRLLWRQLRYLIRSGVNSLGAWLLFIILISYICSFKPDSTIFGGLIGAFVVLLTLQRNSTVQRAEFISGYLSQFYTNSNLWRTYHQLIYQYWDRDFEKIDGHAKEDKKRMKNRIENPESYEGPLPPTTITVTTVGKDEPPSLTYHPWLFQGSGEEERIDALLGFLNGVDYYCAKGLIGVGEVYRHMGTHLLALDSRKVMESYFEINDIEWRNRVLRGNMGVEPATKRAKNLLSCIKAYDKLLIIKRLHILLANRDRS